MERLQEMLIAALKKQGMRAIFGSSGTKFKPTEDQTIYYADYIPFTWLFPRVKAVIHHGGCGTTHLGLRYGKPTFVIAFGGDQEFWGDRVWKLNVGPKPLCVNHNEVTVEALACGLEQLKKGVFEDKARMIGETLKRDKGVIAAADSIERIWKGRWNEY